MTNAVLLVDKGEGIATLTLNRPEKMNALSYPLRRALADELAAIAEDDSIGVVILTGAGRAFCAGLVLCQPQMCGSARPQASIRGVGRAR